MQKNIALTFSKIQVYCYHKEQMNSLSYLMSETLYVTLGHAMHFEEILEYEYGYIHIKVNTATLICLCKEAYSENDKILP